MKYIRYNTVYQSLVKPLDDTCNPDDFENIQSDQLNTDFQQTNPHD